MVTLLIVLLMASVVHADPPCAPPGLAHFTDEQRDQRIANWAVLVKHSQDAEGERKRLLVALGCSETQVRETEKRVCEKHPDSPACGMTVKVKK